MTRAPTAHIIRCLSCGYDVASLIAQRGRDEPGLCPECGGNLRDTLENRRIPARCIQCGLNLSPAVEEHGESGVPECPECAAPTACVFEQQDLIPWRVRRTPKNWVRTIWQSVRTPNRLLRSVPMGGNQNFLFGLMNLFIGIVLLSVPTAIAYVIGADETMQYLFESAEVADIVWIAISIAFDCGLAALFVGAVMTLCVYRRLSGSHLHPLDAGLLMASCWCVALCVLGVPAGVAYGFMLGRWWVIPPLYDALAALGLSTICIAAVTGTIYGIWRLRYHYPNQRPYRARPRATTP